ATDIHGALTTLTTPEGVFVTGPQQSTSATLTTALTRPDARTTIDSATLSGGTKAPTGSVIFRLYGPSDPTCSGAPAPISSPRRVRGDGTVGDRAPPARAGPYSWAVAYSGDANNAPIPTACGQSSQTVNVDVASTRVTPVLTPNGQSTRTTVPA